jgi:hypothetical protein
LLGAGRSHESDTAARAERVPIDLQLPVRIRGGYL